MQTEGTGSDTAVLNQPAEQVAEDELETLRAKVEELQTKLDKKSADELEIIKLEKKVGKCDADIAAKQTELKEMREEREGAVAALRGAIRERELYNQGYRKLPFGDGEATVAVEFPGKPTEDTAGARPLCEIGLTDKQVEALAQADIDTVADLEAFMRDGKFVPGTIPGFGKEKLAAIADKLTAFRAEHPNPNEKPPAPIDGQWDPTQYFAGEIAYSEGKPASDNPHADGSHAHDSWFAGWREKQIATPQARNGNPKKSNSPIKKAYKEGCEAALAEASHLTCPYDIGTDQHVAWRNGWSATMGDEITECDSKPEADFRKGQFPPGF